MGRTSLMTVVQAATLFAKTPALYYASGPRGGGRRCQNGPRLGPVQLLREFDDDEAQPAWAKRPGDHAQDGPQELHVGPNGTWVRTVTPEFNPGRINESEGIRCGCGRIRPAAELPR